MISIRQKLYIFDVDGTLRWTRTPGQHCPFAADEWGLMPNVAQVLRAIPSTAESPWLAIASDQPGVGDNIISREIAHQMLFDAVHAAIGYLPPRMRIEMCLPG